MFSIHQAAGLDVITIYFPPSCSPPSTPHCTGLTSGMLVLLFLAHFLIGFPPEVHPERRRDDVSKSLQIKSQARVPLDGDGCN